MLMQMDSAFNATLMGTINQSVTESVSPLNTSTGHYSSNDMTCIKT